MGMLSMHHVAQYGRHYWVQFENSIIDTNIMKKDMGKSMESSMGNSVRKIKETSKAVRHTLCWQHCINYRALEVHAFIRVDVHETFINVSKSPLLNCINDIAKQSNEYTYLVRFHLKLYRLLLITVCTD